ncbi:hypothetical protein A6R68_02191 [Neotoma lepida]|uniref:Uncharacterized protein n=1 Tax=Neotoma lepida TaxID=56216 RepID=A0A1A6GSY3_NEOLE|nr:hypothetical protein A6R68_02191 [Neotoma lepida]
MGRGSAHGPLSTEEIEKKLNIYHMGAKMWKMLIFCQVEPAFSFLPRRRGKQMIETYFDFRLNCLRKSRQYSKLLDFDDVL